MIVTSNDISRLMGEVGLKWAYIIFIMYILKENTRSSYYDRYVEIIV